MADTSQQRSDATRNDTLRYTAYELQCSVSLQQNLFVSYSEIFDEDRRNLFKKLRDATRGYRFDELINLDLQCPVVWCNVIRCCVVI